MNQHPVDANPTRLARRSTPRTIARVASTLVVCLLTSCASTTKPAPASSRQYAFWPQPPVEPRVQYIRSFVYSTDVSQ